MTLVCTLLQDLTLRRNDKAQDFFLANQSWIICLPWILPNLVWQNKFFKKIWGKGNSVEIRWELLWQRKSTRNFRSFFQKNKIQPENELLKLMNKSNIGDVQTTLQPLTNLPSRFVGNPYKQDVIWKTLCMHSNTLPALPQPLRNLASITVFPPDRCYAEVARVQIRKK